MVTPRRDPRIIGQDWRLGRGPRSTALGDVLHALRVRISRKLVGARGGLGTMKRKQKVEPWEIQWQKGAAKAEKTLAEWRLYHAAVLEVETIVAEFKTLKEIGTFPHLVLRGNWLYLMPENKRFGCPESAVEALVMIQRRMKDPRE